MLAHSHATALIFMFMFLARSNQRGIGPPTGHLHGANRRAREHKNHCDHHLTAGHHAQPAMADKSFLLTKHCGVLCQDCSTTP
jgi:hypothetical protein